MPKASNPRALNRSAKHVEARSKPLATQIARWLRRYAKLVVDEELKGGAITKAKGDDKKLREEMLALIRRFGVRQANRASSVAVDYTGPLVESQIMRDYLGGKETLIQNLADETREAIRAGVQEIIARSRREIPTPSAGEIASRIHAIFVEARSHFADPFVQGELAPLGFAVSHERASLIARTEMVQAENTGIVAGYEQTGVEEIEWLAYRDGRSGKRHHERMNGKKVKVGEKFTMPSRKKLRYPGDPAGHISETANCRCTVIAVRRKKKK